MALAFGIVTVLYVGLAVATIGVTSGAHSKVPLADLIAVGFGRAGRDATAVLAVALTMGTMNVYIGGAAKLAAALAQQGALPRGSRATRTGASRAARCVVIAVVGVVLLGALVAGFSSTDDLIRATSACFVAVYCWRFSAARILDGSQRVLQRHARVDRRARGLLGLVPRSAARGGGRRLCAAAVVWLLAGPRTA